MLRVLLVLPVLLACVLVISSQTFVLRSLLVPELEAALNVDVETSRVVIASDGSIVMHDARFRVHDVPGAPGEFLRVRRLRAWVDWMALVRGEPALRRLRPIGAVVRFSQDVDDSSLNVESLRLDARAGRSGVTTLPRIDPSWVLVDLGEHRGGKYTPLRLVKLSAAISPERSGYTVVLREPMDSGSMSLTARIDEKGVTASLTGMKFEAWRPESMPSPIRPFLTSLDLSGGVSEVAFTYDEAAGVEAIVHVRGVAMNIPGIQRHDDPETDEHGRPLRMAEVDGTLRVRDETISADLRGWLEDLPYEVRLRWHGLSPDSGFDAEFATRGFQLERNPRLLPFAPALARYRFESFSRPTATVDAFVTVSRGEPVNGAAAPVRQHGRIYFTDCEASYNRFPYPFHDMTGEIEFDDDEVRIVEIRGVSETGAVLRAHGHIGPLDDTAEAHLWIDVDGVPIDATLKGGLGPERGEILDELFSEEAAAELAARGVLPAEEEFALGGKIDLRIYLHRHRGEESMWDQRIEVRMPRVGVLAKRFPLPCFGEDVVLLIDDDFATITGGLWRTSAGDAIELSARVGLHDESGGPAFDPDIRVTATEIALSEHVIEALPTNDSERSPREIVRGLGPSGTGSVSAVIVRRETSELGFDVSIEVHDGVIAPRAQDESRAGKLLGDIRGTIECSESRLMIDLIGAQASPQRPLLVGTRTDAPTGDANSDGTGGQIRIRAEVEYEGDDVSYDILIDGSRVDLAARAEDAVRVFSEDAAERAVRVRAAVDPEGVIDGRLNIRSSALRGDDPLVTADIDHIHGLSLRVIDGRLGLANTSGTVRLVLGEGGVMRFESVRCSVTFDDDPAGEVALHGDIALAMMDEEIGASATANAEPPATTAVNTTAIPATSLSISVTGARFESNLSRRVVERRIGGDFARWYGEADPAGAFSHQVLLTSGVSESRAAPRVDTTITPTTFEFTHNGARVRFGHVAGRIHTCAEGGEFAFDRLHASEFNARAHGRWASHAEGGVSVRVRAEVDSAGLPADVVSLLPHALREAIADLELRAEGAVSVEDMVLAYTTLADGAWSASGSGLLRFEDVALSAGVNFQDVCGEAGFTFSREFGEDVAAFELDVRAPVARADGVSLSNLHARILGPGDPGEVVVPFLAASAHGGRISAVSHVRPARDEEHREYLIEATLAEVAFGALVSELRQGPDVDARGRDAATPGGLISGHISLTGLVGDEHARRGQGVLVVGGGEVVKMPLALPLIEASNLALPLGAELDTARADFYIDGDMIAFEELSLVSPAVWIWGYGRMRWSTRELDLRFNSRAAKRFPILSDLLEGIRNQLVSVRVGGTLGRHQVSLERLPGPLRAFDRVFGRRASERRRRLDELESRFDWNRWGSWPMSQGQGPHDTIAPRR